VLVVDDEDVLLEMVAIVVEDLGHQPILASDGYEALSLLHAEPMPPALMISDVMMPRMNGLELIRAIRVDRRYLNMPIILMSAANQSSARNLADQFIPKPFELDELEALIQRFLLG
jgi:CheY-like chemotaxis protein